MIISSCFGTMVRKVESISKSANINKDNSRFCYNGKSNRKKENNKNKEMSFKEVLEKELSRNK
ncbi:MAG: hypothetical protein PHC47_03490 [Clostridia bacterium]|nr:hypothetical protein [Clostridia bacterium]